MQLTTACRISQRCGAPREPAPEHAADAASACCIAVGRLLTPWVCLSCCRAACRAATGLLADRSRVHTCTVLWQGLQTTCRTAASSAHCSVGPKSCHLSEWGSFSSSSAVPSDTGWVGSLTSAGSSLRGRFSGALRGGSVTGQVAGPGARVRGEATGVPKPAGGGQALAPSGRASSAAAAAMQLLPCPFLRLSCRR